MPNIKSLRRWFGGECDDGVIRSTNGNMSVLCDCLNYFILDLVIGKYNTSEKALLKENLKNISEIGFLKDKLKIFILV